MSLRILEQLLSFFKTSYQGLDVEREKTIWVRAQSKTSPSSCQVGAYQTSEENIQQQFPRVGNRIFLFGGTSPYHGPPLYFTPEQLALLPHQEEDQTSKVKVILKGHFHLLYLLKNLRNMISHKACRFS